MNNPTLFYHKSTEPLGVGQFLCEGIMSNKDILSQFHHMVGELLSIDDDFICCEASWSH